MTPKAVLVISGHWEERAFTGTSSATPPMIYGYSGFPEHTYRIEYAPPGSPQTAEPAPERGKRTTWATFLRAHWKV